MNHNPYAPPTSSVADPELPAATLIARPRTATIAVAFCWVSALIAMPGIIFGIIKDAARFPGATYVVVMAIVLALFLGLGFTVIVFLGLGRRWARILYSVLSVMSLFTLRSGFIAAFAQGRLFGGLYLLGTILDVAVIILLFLPASNAWFRAVSAARKR